MSRPPVLVAGATGTQGGAVARHLLRLGLAVRGLTRNASSPAARALAAARAQTAAGDMRDPASPNEAVKDASAVFSVQDFYAPGLGYRGEIEQGRNLAEAARRVGVEHFVQSTMAATDDPGEVEHLRSMFEIERIVRDLGLPFTFIGMVCFIDNVANPARGGMTTFPALAGTLRSDTPFQTLAADDLDRAVPRIIAEPTGHVGRRHDLVSETTSMARMKADYRAVTDRTAKRWRLPNFMLRRFAPEFAVQLRWHRDHGWRHGPKALRALIGEPTTFATYLRAHPNVPL